jgi:hypothetical protein
MMADTSPCILYWGESHSIIYNEASVPLLGDKHPNAMGMAAQDWFPQFWNAFGKVIAEQRQNGLTLRGEASMVLIERLGFLEETYVDWKLIPILGQHGEVKGSYGMPTDLTTSVIRQRQIDCTRNLNDLTMQANDMTALWRSTLAGLSNDSKDIGLALVYTLDNAVPANSSVTKGSLWCSLETSIGLGTGQGLARQKVDLQGDTDGFAPTMLGALKTNSTLVLEANDILMSGHLDATIWTLHKVPPQQFVIIPLVSDGVAFAFLVAAISPYRRYGPLYEEFFEIVRNILETQISRVRLAQEVERQDQLARQATLDLQRSELKFHRFSERSIAGLAIIDIDCNVRSTHFSPELSH